MYNITSKKIVFLTINHLQAQSLVQQQISLHVIPVGLIVPCYYYLQFHMSFTFHLLNNFILDLDSGYLSTFSICCTGICVFCISVTQVEKIQSVGDIEVQSEISSILYILCSNIKDKFWFLLLIFNCKCVVHFTFHVNRK